MTAGFRGTVTPTSERRRSAVAAFPLGLAIVVVATLSAIPVYSQHDADALLVEEAALYMSAIERVVLTPGSDVRRHLAQLPLILSPALLTEILETSDLKWEVRTVLTTAATARRETPENMFRT